MESKFSTVRSGEVSEAGDLLTCPRSMSSTTGSFGSSIAATVSTWAPTSGPVAAAVGQMVASAQRESMPVLLGVDISAENGAEALRWLPWEALPVPGSGVPLALHYLVTCTSWHTRGVVLEDEHEDGSPDAA